MKKNRLNIIIYSIFMALFLFACGKPLRITEVHKVGMSPLLRAAWDLKLELRSEKDGYLGYLEKLGAKNYERACVELAFKSKLKYCDSRGWTLCWLQPNELRDILYSCAEVLPSTVEKAI